MARSRNPFGPTDRFFLQWTVLAGCFGLILGHFEGRPGWVSFFWGGYWGVFGAAFGVGIQQVVATEKGLLSKLIYLGAWFVMPVLAIALNQTEDWAGDYCSWGPGMLGYVLGIWTGWRSGLGQLASAVFRGWVGGALVGLMAAWALGPGVGPWAAGGVGATVGLGWAAWIQHFEDVPSWVWLVGPAGGLLLGRLVALALSCSRDTLTHTSNGCLLHGPLLLAGMVTGTLCAATVACYER